ncbi:MAG: hypothetical protein K0S80_3558 [Neobacillus sp.]|nr:hypothetical protein [Neobacillus sp.]
MPKDLLVKARKKLVIVCEDLDFLWDEHELMELAVMWRCGSSVEGMTKYFNRNDPDEVVLALIHLAREDKIKARKLGLKGGF